MRYRWDKKYLYWGVTVFCVFACSLLFYQAVVQWRALLRAINRLADILAPIITGFAIAYLLSPLLGWCEKNFLLKAGARLFPKSEKNAWRFARITGIVIVIALLLLIIVGLLLLAMPQVYSGIQKLVQNMEGYYNTAIAWLEGLFQDNAEAESTLAGLLRGAVNYFTNWVQTGLLPKIEGILVDVSTGVITVVMTIFDFIVGVMVSCYILYRKEGFIRGATRLSRSIFTRRGHELLSATVRRIHHTFGQFFIGKLLDSLIIGIMCGIFMVFAKMPYAALISVIVGVTNVIPFFGPYLGAIPSGFMILLENPLKCLIFVIFILVLQQFDGNILGPRILGSSTGLSGFWIIFAILLFGGLFGVLGMLCGVPIVAVIYASVRDWCARRLAVKDAEAAEPPGDEDDET